jgi:phage-related protein
MTLNAVQTTMAGTGKTAEEVEKQLKKLDEYADKTVYSTADMLNNLPKFTNAGVELEKATTAMIGIANATALAGGDAGKASIAFYNLGQAIGTGYLTRMDYNSINNAGIATMEWKNQMIEAAIAQGTLTKVGENSYKAGKKTYTLQQLFIDGLQEQWATTDVMMKVFGDYGDETTEIGKKAQASAQNIKSFTMMMDSLKATAGTGWKDTWQLIFGDLDAATKFWTELSNFISGIIEGMADARNKLLEGALGKSFKGLADKINNIISPAKKAADTVKGATTAVKDLGNIVDKVILGSFGNGKDRIDALTKAGYNYYEVQNKVNEKLGNSFRYSTDLTKAQGKLNDSQKDGAKTAEKLSDADAALLEDLTKLSDAELESMGYTKDQIKALRELKKEADKLGMTVSDFVKNIDELNGRTILINSFKNIGQGLVTVFKSIKDAWVDIFPPATAEQLYNIIAGFHKLSTHFVVGDETADKLTRTFKGLFAALDIILTIVGGPIKIAFKILSQLLGAFDLNILDVTAGIGDAIVKFRDWLDSVLDFTGIFEKIAPIIRDCIDAIKQWISNIVDYITPGLESIKEKFGELGRHLVDGLKNGLSNGGKAVWDAVLNFGRKILECIKKVLGINSPSTETFEIGVNLIQGLVNGLKQGASAIFDIIKNLGSNIIGSFEDFDWSKLSAGIRALTAFVPALKGLDKFAALSTYMGSVGADTVNGLVGGLTDGIGKIMSVMGQIGRAIIDSICNVLGINSPSKVFMAIGGFLIAGLIAGLTSDAEGVTGVLKDIGVKMFTFVKDAFINILEFIKNISFGEVITIAITAGLIFAIKKTIDIIDTFAGAVEGFGKAASGAGDLMKAFANKIDPKKNKFSEASDNILKMAISIGILAGSVYILAQLKPGQLWSAVGAVTALAIVIGALTFAADKMQLKGSDFSKITLLLLGIAGALLILSKVVKSISGMEWSELGKAAVGLGGLLAFTAVLMLITKIGNTKKVGVMLLQMALTLTILKSIAKSLAKMEWSEMGKAAVGLGGLVAIMALLMLVTKIGNSKKIGSMLFKMAGAMALLALVVKLISGMEWGEMGKAAIGLGGLIGFMAILMLVTKLGNFKKVGSMLMQMAGAMAILALVARLISGMEWGEMGKAAVGLTGLAGIIALLIWSTKLAGGNDLKGVGRTLIAAAGAIAILAGIAVILGMVDPSRLQQGVIAVTTLGVLMALLIAVTERAQKCVGTLVVLTVAVALLVGAVVGLSFIDPSKLAGATTALTILMGMFALLMYSTSLVKGGVGTIVAMTVALVAIAGALYLVGSLPTGSALPAALALSAIMLALSASLFIISKVGKVSVNALAAITIIGLTILALAGALAIVAALPVDNALVAALALSAVMLALSASLLIISNMSGSAVVGAAALLIVAGALAILTPCLQTLGSMSLAQIGTGLLALAGALAVIGIAGALLSGAAIGLIALGAAVALIGAGCMMAGVGVSLFVSALTQFMMTAMMLAGQGPVIAAGITAMIQGICMAIVSSTSAITSAITAVIIAITQALITSVPAILNCANVMITSFLNFLVSVVPKFVNAGMQIIQGILQGIADNIGGIIDAATDIIVNFLDGISRNLPRIIDSGIKLVISFINGMADGIRNNTDSMISAVNNLMDAVMSAIKKWFSNAVSKGGELVGKLVSGVKSKFGDMKSAAKDMMDGFIKGVGEKFGAIKDKAVNAVKGAVDAVKNFLGINSPSKLFATFGRYTDEGFIVGLEQYAKDVYNAGSDLGHSVATGLRDSLDINSPAKVMIEDGKYIVQGIAEGIKSDMSAEDAAAKKAKNIEDAFKTEFSKLDTDVGTLDKEYKLWEATSGQDAGSVKKLGAEVSLLAKKIEKQKEIVELARGEHQVTQDVFGDTAEETQKAYNKFLDQQLSLAELENQHVAKQNELVELQKDLDEDIADLEYELWKSRNDAKATEVEKLMVETSYLNKKIAAQRAEVDNAQKEYNKALMEYGSESDKTKELYINLLTQQKSLSELENELSDAQNTRYSSQRDRVKAYSDYLNEFKEPFLAMGMTIEEIEKAAAKSAGWSPHGLVEDLFPSLGDTTPGTALLTNYGSQASVSFSEGLKSEEYSGVKETVTELVDTCTSTMESQYSEWKSAGSKLVTGFIEGVRAKIADAAKAGSEIARATVSAARSITSGGGSGSPSFVGANITTGMAKGISGNVSTVLKAASNAAKAAVNAVKKQLAIKSPSRVFAELGMYVDEGFAQGIYKYANAAENAAASMSEDTVEAVKSPLSKIMDLINGDLDTTPTIRPILDLSEIQNGATRINGMFGQRSVALAGINTRISNIEQMRKFDDPGNADIVAAISELRGDFGSLANAVNHMQIRMDSGTVVGELIGKIDSRLGQIVNHKGRGN